MSQKTTAETEQKWSLTDWRMAISTYVEKNERHLQRVNEKPPAWVRLIAGILGFCASFLAMVLPGIALLIFDRLIPAENSSALWQLFGLSVATILSVSLIDLLRMQALGVYFTNARSLILYQDACFALFWAFILAFIHPFIALIPIGCCVVLYWLWKIRKPSPKDPVQSFNTMPDDPAVIEATGLGVAFLKLALAGQINSNGTLDFQSIGQAVWLNFVQITASISTLALAASLHISGFISLGGVVAIMLLNQYIIAVFVRYFQIAALQPISAHRLYDFTETTAQPSTNIDTTNTLDILQIEALEAEGFAPFSAELLPGLCLTLIGPSGAGKSKILRALATGQFDEGKVTFRNRNWGRNHGRISSLAYATVPGIVLPGTVVENITCFDPTAHVKSAIELLRELDPFDDVFQDVDIINDKITLQNLGQLQLINLARAFWRDSDILILDRPETHLDKASRAGLMALILKAKTDGKLVILATDDEYLMSLGDEVVKLERGECTDRGPMDEVLARYHQRWVRVTFKPTKRDSFRLGLWLDAQFPRGISDDLRLRVKQTAQDILFFALHDQMVTQDDEIVFDLRVDADEICLSMHDRGDLIDPEHLNHEFAINYQRIIEQSDGFEQKLHKGYRQFALEFKTRSLAASRAGGGECA